MLVGDFTLVVSLAVYLHWLVLVGFEVQSNAGSSVVPGISANHSVPAVILIDSYASVSALRATVFAHVRTYYFPCF